MKKFSFLSLLLLTLVYTSCKNNSSNNGSATTATSPSTVSNTLPENLSVKWRFDNKMNADSSEPVCDLYINVNGKEALVQKALTINLEEIKAPFEPLDKIPNDALLACRGFWAGWDCRMYVRREGEKLVVFEGAHPEGSDLQEGEKYEGIIYTAFKTVTVADLK